MNVDIAIIGAGMAGASLAAALGGKQSVALIEMEDQPGYHATGRSAAFWNETYGGPGVQPLTSASGPWLAQPPEEYGGAGFLRPRRALHLAHRNALRDRDRFLARFASSGIDLRPMEADECCDLVPGLRREWANGILEPSCTDIDVAALHQAYLRRARQCGARLLTRRQVTRLDPDEMGWTITTAQEALHARRIVNAAGAWASEIARLADAAPIAVQPLRRTMVQLRLAQPLPESMPLVLDLAGRFYFKPEPGGRLWLSPHDETPMPPCDAAPDELDVALALDRLASVTDWKVETIEHRWAGLRSFTPDRLPVYGLDPIRPGFFWFAGQGGFGIQTAPAAAALAASMLLEEEPPFFVAGIDAAAYDPARFF